MTAEEHALLEAAATFRTLDEQARFYAMELERRTRRIETSLQEAGREVLPRAVNAWLARRRARRTIRSQTDSRLAGVRADLDSLVDRGLLVAETVLKERCFQAPQRAEPPPPISTLAVTTRDRVESLQRCLESYIEHAGRHGREVDYLVVDGSPSASTRDQTRSLLSRLSRDRRLTIRYAGLEEKQRYAAALGNQGAPQPLVEFALFDPEGCSLLFGAARNAVQFATLGQVTLAVDDDTVCQVSAIPGSDDGLALSSTNDPTQTWFYPDRVSALAAGAPVDRDLLAIHEGLLGREVANCLERSPDPAQLQIEDMDAALFHAVESGRARVVCTSTGSLGDGGSGMPAAIRLLDLRSRGRLLENEAAYRSVAGSRELGRGVAVPTISNGPYLSTTTTTGLDHRGLLPPFFPVFRNEDGIFAFTLRACIDGGFIGHFPFAVVHAPAEPRVVAPDALERLARHPSSFEITIACIQSLVPSPGTSDESRLRRLGRHLVEVASQPADDFEEYARIWIWRSKALFVAALSRDLEAVGTAPPFWKADVDRYLELLRGSLAARDYVVPQDLAERFGASVALDVMQRLLRRFGELLQGWPEIDEAARSLRNRGIELPIPM